MGAPRAQIWSYAKRHRESIAGIALIGIFRERTELTAFGGRGVSEQFKSKMSLRAASIALVCRMVLSPGALATACSGPLSAVGSSRNVFSAGYHFSHLSPLGVVDGTMRALEQIERDDASEDGTALYVVIRKHTPLGNRFSFTLGREHGRAVIVARRWHAHLNQLIRRWPIANYRRPT
jgi:hypothetical protein